MVDPLLLHNTVCHVGRFSLVCCFLMLWIMQLMLWIMKLMLWITQLMLWITQLMLRHELCSWCCELRSWCYDMNYAADVVNYAADVTTWIMQLMLWITQLMLRHELCSWCCELRSWCYDMNYAADVMNYAAWLTCLNRFSCMTMTSGREDRLSDLIVPVWCRRQVGQYQRSLAPNCNHQLLDCYITSSVCYALHTNHQTCVTRVQMQIAVALLVIKKC